MCGIVSIIGNYKLNLIIECLYNLQNRGYDSAGISFIDEYGKYSFKKECHKESIDNLLKYTKSTSNVKNTEFNNCISHTRWATHGGITSENCHPHISNNGKISLVHNGIIENYFELKQFLLKKNFTFYSETDSEIIVNLIEYFITYEPTESNESDEISNSIQKALSLCIGTWGLVIQYIEEPFKLYAIKKGSPLLLGKNDNISIITSEASGFNNLINNYHELISDCVYVIDNNCNISKEHNISNLIDYNIKNEINLVYSLGDFKHYTLKEIHEQQNIINKITNNGSRIKNNKIFLGGLYDYKEKILNCDNIVLFGCGTSYNACLYSIYHFKKLCNFKNVIAIDTCNFEEYLLPSGKNCYFFISQSGETKDLFSVFEIIKKNKNLNGITVGIINVVNSLIARNVDCGVYLNIGKEMSVASTKVFMAQSLILILVGLYLSNDTNNLINNYINSIRNLEELIKIELNKEINIETFNNGFILASGTLFPIAMEASLKFKEITYSHIEPLSVNSLKHGPLALVSEKNFVNIILGKHESVKQEILARNGQVINIEINYENIFNDLLYIIHLQRYNYLLSLRKGINPDFPRNLAKVVTV
jgi:glucosamine--fructose-6-phosphate aminotransferase (isomerizing)